MITKCRSCHSSNLTEILSLGNQYLSAFISEGDSKPDKYPLNLVMCKNCTLLQLKDTVPPQKMYNDNYGFKSGINNTIRADLKDIVTKAMKFHKGGSVVDIGANDGTLLSFYGPLYYKIGYEPVTKYANECKRYSDIVINDFFSSGVYPKNTAKAKIVTAISMFYDLDDPNKFVSDVASILADDGIWIIQQNYLVGMLKQNAFDNIVHEHLEYYTLTSLEKLLNRHGLEVFDVETNDINGGSFRTYVRHMDRVKKMRYQERQLKLDNQWTYYLFALKVRGIKKQLYNFIKNEVDKGKNVYVYGASTRGNTLLQYCGLDNKLIKAAVERNPEKFGKKIASVNIPIISEEQARKEKFDYALFLPWFFRSELVSRYQYLKEKGVKFIFPLPKLEII